MNDTFGHNAGDYILKSVAQRLSTTVRKQDMATRMGGDEYFILINSQDEIDLDAFCCRLLVAIREPYIYESERLNISVSIGVARVTRDNMTIDDLLKRADDAMYKNNRQSKNNYLIT